MQRKQPLQYLSSMMISSVVFFFGEVFIDSLAQFLFSRCVVKLADDDPPLELLGRSLPRLLHRQGSFLHEAEQLRGIAGPFHVSPRLGGALGDHFDERKTA